MGPFHKCYNCFCSLFHDYWQIDFLFCFVSLPPFTSQSFLSHTLGFAFLAKPATPKKINICLHTVFCCSLNNIRFSSDRDCCHLVRRHHTFMGFVFRSDGGDYERATEIACRQVYRSEGYFYLRISWFLLLGYFYFHGMFL